MLKTLTLSLVLLSVFVFNSPVFAQCTDDSCPASGIVQVREVITRLINLSVSVAFLALTVWLVWSAIKLFIVSGGEPKALAEAWSSVTWAFMGIFFLVLAYISLRLIGEIAGFNVSEFCLGFPPYCV